MCPCVVVVVGGGGGVCVRVRVRGLVGCYIGSLYCVETTDIHEHVPFKD